MTEINRAQASAGPIQHGQRGGGRFAVLRVLATLGDIGLHVAKIQCASVGDLSTNVSDMIAEMSKLTNGQLGRIGALCLIGTSNGSAYILALAKALKGRAPKPAWPCTPNGLSGKRVSRPAELRSA